MPLRRFLIFFMRMSTIFLTNLSNRVGMRSHSLPRGGAQAHCLPAPPLPPNRRQTAAAGSPTACLGLLAMTHASSSRPDAGSGRQAGNTLAIHKAATTERAGAYDDSPCGFEDAGSRVGAYDDSPCGFVDAGSRVGARDDGEGNAGSSIQWQAAEDALMDAGPCGGVTQEETWRIYGKHQLGKMRAFKLTNRALKVLKRQAATNTLALSGLRHVAFWGAIWAVLGCNIGRLALRYGLYCSAKRPMP